MTIKFVTDPENPSNSYYLIEGKKFRIVDADFSYANLSGIRISGYETDRNRADYPTVVELTRINLQGADLSDAYLAACWLNHANLCETTLERASLHNIRFDDGTNSPANMSSVNFAQAKLIKVDFDYADLTDADFRSATIDTCSFNYTHLKNSNFSGAQIINCYVFNTFIGGAILPDGKRARSINDLKKYGCLEHNRKPFSYKDFGI